MSFLRLKTTGCALGALLLAASAVAPPTPALAQELSNVATLSDGQAALDVLSLQVTDLPPAPDGGRYRVWLLSQDLGLAQLAGDLVADESGAASVTWEEPLTQNLLRAYSQVLVTLETSEAPDALPGPAVVLAGQVDPGALVSARRLLARWPDSRYGIGSMLGLRGLSGLTQLHASLLLEAAQQGDLAAVQRKAEQLVNLVTGQGGSNFGDLNGDGLVEDPGDGVGLLGYALGAREQAGAAWIAAVDDVVAGDALALDSLLVAVADRAGALRDDGLRLLATQDVAEAQQLAQNIALAVQDLNGLATANADNPQDVSGDAIATDLGLQPPLVASAYQQALRLARMPLQATGGQ